nr:hypothetical protein [Tanacetum cinerariifolium]
DDIQTNSKDPLTYAMLLLARAITQNFFNSTNNRVYTSSNTINQEVIQGDRVYIQSKNFGNAGRNNRRAYVQEEVVEGSNETGNVQRTLQNSSSKILQLNATTVVEKDTIQGIVQSQEFETRNTSWNKCCWPNRMKLEEFLTRNVMLGPKPLSVYDQQLKHGLGYSNPYTLKQTIAQCPKLYLTSSLGNSEIPLNIRDNEDTLDDASKSQQKLKEKMNDPIAIAN